MCNQYKVEKQSGSIFKNECDAGQQQAASFYQIYHEFRFVLWKIL